MHKTSVLVEVQKRKLSDGSYVYDVEVWEPARWHATDEKAALALQDAIVEAARKYANNDTIPGLTET